MIVVAAQRYADVVGMTNDRSYAGTLNVRERAEAQDLGALPQFRPREVLTSQAHVHGNPVSFVGVVIERGQEPLRGTFPGVDEAEDLGGNVGGNEIQDLFICRRPPFLSMM